MKKLILVIPVIALLAAACNNSQQTSIQTPPVTENTNATSNSKPTTYCTGSIPREIGDVVYPVDPKYGKLNWLGQIFTANDCGAERLKEVAGDNFDVGSSLKLKTVPKQDFISVLTEIGYVCSNSQSASNCTEWQLNKSVKVKDVLKLQPFASFIEYDGCINCG